MLLRQAGNARKAGENPLTELLVHESIKDHYKIKGTSKNSNFALNRDLVAERLYWEPLNRLRQAAAAI